MSVAVGPSLNGAPPPMPNNIDEIREYEKIIELRNQVFAGSHPRLKVPAHAIRKVSPLPPQVAPQPHTALSIPFSSETPNVKLPGLQLTANAKQPLPTIPPLNAFPAPPVVSKPQPAQPTLSGIDPVLLTKSDDLVRAETFLQRQRLERSLKEQFEKKRTEARRWPNPQEAKPDFDVPASLARALEVAKPELLAKPASPSDAASATDSFDENSFYSSKAPDSTPEEGVRRRPSPPSNHQVQPIDEDDLDADGLVDRRGRRGQQVDMTDSPYKIIPRPDYNTGSNGRAPPLSWQDRNKLQGKTTVDLTAMDLDDDDEPEYSPPEPMEQLPTQRANGASRMDDQLRRPLRNYSDFGQNGNGYGSPTQAETRIVRNHITSPLAPQPCRVSPLAIAKAPPISQNARTRRERNRQYQNGRPESRSSPEASTQPMHPPKKRKIDKKTGKRGTRRNQGDPYIKDEPVSPPPFLEKRPLVPVRQVPAEGDPYAAASERFAAASPRRIAYEVEPPMPHSEPRPYSRAARPLVRDNQDLRKAASMHNMRAEQPSEYEADYDSPSRTRATSYAIVERESDRPRMYEDAVPAYDRQQPAEERVMRSPAPVFRDPETGIRYERRSAMPPPQRRIAIDEYGNEVIYEMVTPQRSSVAPRPSRQIELEAYNETAYSRNRATSVYADPIPETRYAHEMPPPSVKYRRVTETPRMSTAESRPMIREQQLDPSRIQRSASVQVVDYPTRQPVYLDEPIQPGPTRMSSARPAARYEDAQPAHIRMSSVRPAPRYEDVHPRDIIQRVQSVRPGGREGSVFIDERPQFRREYAEVEQPRYRTIVQDGRYYQVQDREPIMLEDGPEEVGPRFVQRY